MDNADVSETESLSRREQGSPQKMTVLLETGD